MTKRPFTVAALSLLLAGGLAACGKKHEAAAPVDTATPAPAAEPAPPAVEPAPLAVAGGFGVPECDDYMAKYTACIEQHVPEASRAMLLQTLEQSKMSWQQAATTPEGRVGLASGCTQALEAAKQSMTAYGCTW